METKYIFVTGGVVSSLGKGVISSSLACLLKARGFRVTIQKFDPYININSGLLNPYEHGESYVTIDGHEGDLDLGHYERFTNIQTTKANNITSGRIYQNVINRERRGEYSGKTVQVIPHITDEIKRNIKKLGSKGEYDFIITEIGGTVGDIESLPFLESVRQLRWELGDRSVCVHLTYVPYVAAAKELKTKPTQHSVKKLQELGIQPDVLILRTEHDIEAEMRRKIALFCNVDPKAVIQSIDVPTIYEVPLKMHEQGFDTFVLNKTNTKFEGEPDMTMWNNFLNKLKNAEKSVKIGLVGKYVELPDAYKSIMESLIQATTYNDRKLDLKLIQSETINDGNVGQILGEMDGVLIAPGSKPRGVEGKIAAAKWCRENNIPTFGISLGMQCMIVEFARNVMGLAGADSTEMNQSTPYRVIDCMDDQKSMPDVDGLTRMGNFECQFMPNSKVAKAYGVDSVQERHHNRYEVNNAYRDDLEKSGLICVAVNPALNFVEAVELGDKNWYVGVQYHPEYSSTVLNPHPLFVDFVRAAVEYSESK